MGKPWVSRWDRGSEEQTGSGGSVLFGAEHHAPSSGVRPVQPCPLPAVATRSGTGRCLAGTQGHFYLSYKNSWSLALISANYASLS